MIEPGWVMAAIAAGGVVATGAIAWAATTRIQGMEDRLRVAEVKIAVLEAVCSEHGGGDRGDGKNG